MPTQTIQLAQNILHANNETARQNRSRLDAEGILALNLMASPGAGKTSLIVETIRALKDRLRVGMINSDTSSAAMDAERAEEAGAAVVHLDTAGKCHLNAGMVRDAMARLPLREIDLLLIENIGNLVCPAPWSLGSHLNILIASTPEGDDKPYKYPRIYTGVDALVINKIDLLPYVPFSVDYFTRGVAALNENLATFPLSCQSCAGMDRWFRWILSANSSFTERLAVTRKQARSK
jgi:hydrogenase nickel incorporation protein HypB